MLSLTPLTDRIGLNLETNLDRFVFLAFVPLVWFVVGRWLDNKTKRVVATDAKVSRPSPALTLALAIMSILSLSIGVGIVHRFIEMIKIERMTETSNFAAGILYLLWSCSLAIIVYRRTLGWPKQASGWWPG
jgi:uncharacterized membrane protein YoaK (UPF0700 family)